MIKWRLSKVGLASQGLGLKIVCFSLLTESSKKVELWTVGDSHYNPKDYIRDGSEEGIQDEGRKSHFSSLVEVQEKRKYPKIQGTHALTTTSHPTTLYSQILSLHLEVEDYNTVAHTKLSY